VSENSDYNEPIPGDRLKEALHRATAVLGRTAQDALFYDLELGGMMFDNSPYTLRQVNDALKKIFGKDGTVLLMKRLERELKSSNVR
jgi:hypothetical protein